MIALFLRETIKLSCSITLKYSQCLLPLQGFWEPQQRYLNSSDNIKNIFNKNLYLYS